jgi:hypothetical protein
VTGDKVTGDKVTGDKVTRGQSDRGQSERGQSVRTPPKIGADSVGLMLLCTLSVRVAIRQKCN